MQSRIGSAEQTLTPVTDTSGNGVVTVALVALVAVLAGAATPPLSTVTMLKVYSVPSLSPCVTVAVPAAPDVAADASVRIRSVPSRSPLMSTAVPPPATVAPDVAADASVRIRSVPSRSPLMSTAVPPPATVALILTEAMSVMGLVQFSTTWPSPAVAVRSVMGAGGESFYREIEDLSHTYPRDENPRILDWLLRT